MSTQNVITIKLTLRLNLWLARKQRDYLINEAANKRGEEAQLLKGAVELYDHLIDAALDARDGPPF